MNRPTEVILRFPIGGVHPSAWAYSRGEYDDRAPFDRLLEQGTIWRRPTPDDREAIRRWFEVFKEYHSGEHVHRATWEHTVLISEGPVSFDQDTMIEWGARITSLVLSTTLNTRQASIRHQALRFRMDDGKEVPDSGDVRHETLRLGLWPASHSEELSPELVEAVVGLYPYTRRVHRQDPNHRLKRAQLAYRMATSPTRFADPIPVLLCAALEALTGSTKEREVIALVQRYASTSDAADRLVQMYRCRHWFGHGIDFPDMQDPTLRMKSLDEGLLTVKEILRTAFMDDRLFELAGSARDVRRYLEQ